MEIPFHLCLNLGGIFPFKKYVCGISTGAQGTCAVPNSFIFIQFLAKVQILGKYTSPPPRCQRIGKSCVRYCVVLTKKENILKISSFDTYKLIIG